MGGKVSRYFDIRNKSSYVSFIKPNIEFCGTQIMCEVWYTEILEEWPYDSAQDTRINIFSWSTYERLLGPLSEETWSSCTYHSQSLQIK
jgi:hypothetical protein